MEHITDLQCDTADEALDSWSKTCRSHY